MFVHWGGDRHALVSFSSFSFSDCLFYCVLKLFSSSSSSSSSFSSDRFSFFLFVFSLIETSTFCCKDPLTKAKALLTI